MNKAEFHRAEAVQLFTELLREVPAYRHVAQEKAERFVDHIASHAVETVHDLMKAEEAKKPAG